MCVSLEGANAERLIRGSEGGAAGRIVEGLCEAGVNNPVFILEAVDRVEPVAAGALLYLLDPARRTAFRDAYLDVAFDLSAVLWIVRATAPGAIPEPVREHLAVVELPACAEEEKLAIARQHLLTRPFDAPAPAAEAWLPPGSPAPPARIEPVAAPAGPAVVAEREVASARELGTFAAQPPPPGGVEAWRTAACDGEVRFETEAIVRVVRDHTNEAGVAELNRKLAAVCRHLASRRPPGSRGPDIVTPATVREVLGDGDGDALPPAVRAAIESERRRLAKSDGDAAASNNWIDWLEQLPWNRRSDAPSDLAQARAALDAGRGSRPCQGAHRRVLGRGPPQPARSRRRDLDQRAARGRKDLAGPVRRRGPRARVRQAGLRRVARRDGPARPQPHLEGGRSPAPSCASCAASVARTRSSCSTRSDRARSVETLLDPGPPLGRPRTAHPAGDKGRHNRLVDPVAEP